MLDGVVVGVSQCIDPVSFKNEEAQLSLSAAEAPLLAATGAVAAAAVAAAAVAAAAVAAAAVAAAAVAAAERLGMSGERPLHDSSR